MDDVGWVLSEEESAKHTLQHVVMSRLVQPVEIYGMNICEAFIRKDNLYGSPLAMLKD